MAWSQSHFLQSLGWATLNSFWQMALLWCVFVGANSVFKFSPQKKYQLSVAAIATGFAWFIFSFFYYFQSSSASGISILNQTISESNQLLNILLISASVAYLSLLIFPSYRFFKNWKFVQRIKKVGLQKADLNHRLFVQKISSHLNIGKKVIVHLSELVTSPVTVGYLKPIILLPVAAINNLSVQQVEAILLHELSHIKRYDYLVNFLVSIISTFLYFNPFVKLFVRIIEEERENCCDQLVLQFGYDKISYASALLTLEKSAHTNHTLALGATGKNYLLSRIEKIVGMEKKKSFKKNQFAGIIAALLCVVVFNSILIIKEKKQNNPAYAYMDVMNPLNLLNGSNVLTLHSTEPVIKKVNENQNLVASQVSSSIQTSTTKNIQHNFSDVAEKVVEHPAPNSFTFITLDDVDASLTAEQKNKVKTTVAETKKVLNNLAWKEVETVIADALTEKEKAEAKKEYFKALEQKINWQNVEQNMKAQYDKIDWDKVNSNINFAMTNIQLDSMQKAYSLMLIQLDKLNLQISTHTEVSCNPLPDQSLEKIKQSRDELRKKIELLKAVRNPKKVVKL